MLTRNMTIAGGGRGGGRAITNVSLMSSFSWELLCLGKLLCTSPIPVKLQAFVGKKAVDPDPQCLKGQKKDGGQDENESRYCSRIVMR